MKQVWVKRFGYLAFANIVNAGVYTWQLYSFLGLVLESKDGSSAAEDFMFWFLLLGIPLLVQLILTGVARKTAQNTGRVWYEWMMTLFVVITLFISLAIGGEVWYAYASIFGPFLFVHIAVRLVLRKIVKA